MSWSATLRRNLLDFLVELRTGFAFVGRQVHMDLRRTVAEAARRT